MIRLSKKEGECPINTDEPIIDGFSLIDDEIVEGYNFVHPTDKRAIYVLIENCNDTLKKKVGDYLCDAIKGDCCLLCSKTNEKRICFFYDRIQNHIRSLLEDHLEDDRVTLSIMVIENDRFCFSGIGKVCLIENERILFGQDNHYLGNPYFKGRNMVFFCEGYITELLDICIQQERNFMRIQFEK